MPRGEPLFLEFERFLRMLTVYGGKLNGFWQLLVFLKIVRFPARSLSSTEACKLRMFVFIGRDRLSNVVDYLLLNCRLTLRLEGQKLLLRLFGQR